MSGPMHYSAFFVYIVLASVIALTSCSNEKTVEKEVKVPLNNWGLEFKFTPINEATPDEQTLGKAVALIHDPNGSDGTGFFISEDGLFLTNEHIISRDTCSVDRCSGRQIIRDFRPRGEFEVFNHYKILAHNDQLDFALLQVTLPPGKKVPFLRLASQDDPAFLDLSKKDLFLIGHPFTASQQLSKARYWDSDHDVLNLDSISEPGNSGSPVLEKNSGKVIGLYYASEWNKNSTNKHNGSITHDGVAKDIRSIRKLLSDIFQFEKNTEYFHTDLFTKLTQPVFVQNVLPQTDLEILNKPVITPESFFYQFLGSPNENKALSLVLNSALHSVNSKELLEDFLDILHHFDRARGVDLKLSEEQFNLFTKTFIDKDADKFSLSLLSLSQNKITRDQCLSSLDHDCNDLSCLRKLSYYCSTGKTKNGTDIIDILFNKISSLQNEKINSNVLNNIYNIISTQVKLNDQLPLLSKQKVLDALEFVINQTESLRLAFRAENLYTFIQGAPQLLGSKTFFETFK